MADNTQLNTGVGGDVISTDDIAGVKYQRVKVTLGADGVNDGDVASGNPMPVSAASLPLPSGAATSAKQDTIIGHIDGVEAVLTTIDADTGNISTKIDTLAGAVSGTEMQVDIVTIPSVTVTATNLDIRDLTFAADKVDASGTVLGAGTNNIGDVDVLTLPSIPAGTNNIGDVDILSIAAGDNNIGNVDIVTMPAITGTVTANAGTNLNTSALNLEATQADIRTSVQLLDDTVATDGAAAPTKGVLIAGQDGTNAQTIKTDADGNLQVDILTMPSTVVTATDLDIRNLVFATDKVDASGTVLGAGTNNIGDVDILSIAAGDNNIGNVDVVTLPSLPAGTNNIGDVDVLTLPAIPAGNNNIGDVDVASIAAGTNYIGKVRLTDGTTDADIRDLASSNALNVAIVDGSGAQITSFGGGTQYTEGDVDASITGTAMLMEVSGNTLQPVQGSVADGLLVNLGSNNDVTVTGTVTANLAAGTNNIGDVDILSIAAGDNNIGNVDVVTLPSLPAGTNNIGDVDVLTLPSIPAGNNNIGDVDVASIAAGTNYIGKVRLTDGTTDTTVLDLANNNPLTVAIVDGSGDQITSFGGGTQYTEDAAAAANPIGTAVNLIRQDTPAALTTTDGDNVAQRGTNYGAGFVQVLTSSGAFVDTFGGGTQYADGAVEASPTGTVAMGTDGANVFAVHTDTAGDLQVDVLSSALPSGAATSAKQDTGNTSLSTIAGAVSGTEMQVDVLTMPTVTVTATDLDIRNLVFATDKVDISGSTLAANSGVDIGDVTINNAAGASAVNIQDGGNTITVDGTVSVTGVATETTLASLLTSSQLIDDTIVTLGTDVYTEAASKGQVLGAVRRDADTTLVNTTNEFGPLQMDANGRLKVEVFSGETLPVSLTSTTISGTVAVTQSGTWDEVGINDSGNSITVDAPIGTPVFTTLTNATLQVGVIDETGASAVDALAIGGGTAHDAVDSGNPVKVGGVAVSGSASPTSVAAGDRTRFIANQHGIPYQLGGHPNLIVREFDFGTAAQTDLQLSAAAVAADERCYVVGFEAMCDNANSVAVSVRAGFGTASVPTASATGVSGMIASHPGIAAGSGIVLGNAAGIIAVGAAGEEPRLTSSAATSGNLHVVIRYFIIDETP